MEKLKKLVADTGSETSGMRLRKRRTNQFLVYSQKRSSRVATPTVQSESSDLFYSLALFVRYRGPNSASALRYLPGERGLRGSFIMYRESKV